MDVAELKKVIEKEQVVFGFNETLKMAKKKKVEEILIASNCPEELRTNLSNEKLKFQESGMTNKELSAVCKKPFGISVIGIKK